MRRHSESPLVIALIGLLSGCASATYVSGDQEGSVPPSDWNVNLVVCGARGSAFGRADDVHGEDSRGAAWSVLFDEESFDNGVKFRVLGPYLPNMFGFIDLKGEQGSITPLYSQHSGNLDSVCFGPIFCPIFRYDWADTYWSCTLCGLVKFGTWGGGVGLFTFGTKRAIFTTTMRHVPSISWEGFEILDCFICVGMGEDQ